MLTGEVKKRLTEVLTDIVERHRKARAAVADEASKTDIWDFVVNHLSQCHAGVKSFG